ncbi:MAG: hypothetical protein LBF97_06515 [Elusimicrobiota bacterium]|nr:hypothetical protein [Elusimicrobiota bacterium]
MAFFRKYIYSLKYYLFIIFISSFFYSNINICFADTYDSVYPFYSEHYKNVIYNRNNGTDQERDKYVFNDITKDAFNDGIGYDSPEFRDYQGIDFFWNVNISSVSKQAFAAKIAARYGGNSIDIEETEFTPKISTSTFSNVGYLQYFNYAATAYYNAIEPTKDDYIEGNEVIAMNMQNGDFNFAFYNRSFYTNGYYNYKSLLLFDGITNTFAYFPEDYLEQRRCLEAFYFGLGDTPITYDTTEDQNIYIDKLKNFKNLRQKDLSEFNYILFNVKISLYPIYFGSGTPSVTNPPLTSKFSFGVIAASTNTSSNNTVDLRLVNKIKVTTDTTDIENLNFLEKQFIQKQKNDDFEWYQIVIPIDWLIANATSYNIQGNVTSTKLQAPLKTVQSFYFQSANSGYTFRKFHIYMDNFVLFKELPAEIKVFKNEYEITTSTISIKNKETINLKAEAFTSSGTLSVMNPPKWIVTKPDGGEQDYGTGYDKTFSFDTSGDYTISVSTSMYDPQYVTAEGNDKKGAYIPLEKTITVTVETDEIEYKSKFDIYTNNYINYGVLYIFSDSESTIEVTTTTLNNNEKIFKVDYAKASSSGTYAGLSFSVLDGDSGKDLTTFQSGVISFDIKFSDNLDRNLAVSLRTEGVSKENNNTKVKFSDLGIQFISNEWKTVRIPLESFTLKETKLDFSKVFDFLIITDLDAGETTNEFYIKNIMWLSTDTISGVMNLTLLDILNDNQSSNISWNIENADDFIWKAADQYIKMEFRDYSYDKEGTKINIYTDNINSYSTYAPGLINTTNTSKNLDMSWRLTSTPKTKTDLAIKPIYISGDFNVALSTASDTNYFVWHWMQDIGQKYDGDNDKDNFVQAEKEIYSYHKGFHYISGLEGFSATFKSNDTNISSIYIKNIGDYKKNYYSPYINKSDDDSAPVEVAINDTYYLYFGANFIPAKSQENYNAKLKIEYKKE